MPPSLGSTVLFGVLTNEPAQAFVAATGQPTGDAVIQATPYPGGYRAAHVVGFVGDGKAGRVALHVYKQPGDPFRGDADALAQRLGDVPYSDKGLPGHWLYQKDLDKLLEAAAKPTAKTLSAMKRDELFAHAAEKGIDLEGATTLKDALPIVARFHKIDLPA